MDHNASIIQFITVCHGKSQRIRTGNYDLHPHHTEHIRQHRRSIDKIVQQGDLINKHILIPQPK